MSLAGSPSERAARANARGVGTDRRSKINHALAALRDAKYAAKEAEDYLHNALSEADDEALELAAGVVGEAGDHLRRTAGEIADARKFGGES